MDRASMPTEPLGSPAKRPASLDFVNLLDREARIEWTLRRRPRRLRTTHAGRIDPVVAEPLEIEGPGACAASHPALVGVRHVLRRGGLLPAIHSGEMQDGAIRRANTSGEIEVPDLATGRAKRGDAFETLDPLALVEEPQLVALERTRVASSADLAAATGRVDRTPLEALPVLPGELGSYAPHHSGLRHEIDRQPPVEHMTVRAIPLFSQFLHDSDNRPYAADRTLVRPPGHEGRPDGA